MNWKSYLKDDPREWLLEESNPSVRYFALRWLLDKAQDDPQVIQTSQAIAGSAPIQKILKSQRPEGYWGSDARPHHGTKGQLTLLTWLGYQGNGAVRKALDYRIKGCLQANGGYGIEIKERIVYVPCHGAELLRQMVQYGYTKDPRARKLLDWLLEIQDPEGFWPCVSKAKPYPCLWATAVVLRAFRELPAKWLSPQVVASRHRAMELLLDAGLYRYGRSKPSPRWFEFGFPLRFDTDVLEVLELLAPYVAPDDERIQAGLSLVLDKQDENGRWPCEKHPKGGQWMQRYVPFEEIGKPSKWVTLHAMKMLRHLYAEK